jgi:hypothetical protein
MWGALLSSSELDIEGYTSVNGRNATLESLLYNFLGSGAM